MGLKKNLLKKFFFVIGGGALVGVAVLATGALGRPVDILIEEDGVMFMTDDKAGVIYKITFEK